MKNTPKCTYSHVEFLKISGRYTLHPFVSEPLFKPIPTFAKHIRISSVYKMATLLLSLY